MDSLNRLWGVVKYVYHGWHIANLDTLPVSDSIPKPEGEYVIIDSFDALHLKGKWEYKDRRFRTLALRPGMSVVLKDYPLDLLDWGKYIVFYVRGKGKYDIRGQMVYKDYCGGWAMPQVQLDTSWREIRLNLDTLPKAFNIKNVPDIYRDPLNHISPPCDVDGRFVPLLMGIAPLADTLGTYEYEIELSPVYLVK